MGVPYMGVGWPAMIIEWRRIKCWNPECWNPSLRVKLVYNRFNMSFEHPPKVAFHLEGNKGTNREDLNGFRVFIQRLELQFITANLAEHWEILYVCLRCFDLLKVCCVYSCMV